MASKGSQNPAVYTAIKRDLMKGQIAGQLNRWRKLGNIENAFVDLFNKLSNLRV